MIGNTAALQILSWVFHVELFFEGAGFGETCSVSSPVITTTTTTDPPTTEPPTTTTTDPPTTEPTVCAFVTTSGAISGNGADCEGSRCSVLYSSSANLIISCPNNEVTITGQCAKLGATGGTETGPVAATCNNGVLSVSYTDFYSNSPATAQSVTSLECADCPDYCFLNSMRVGSFDICQNAGFTPVLPTNNFGQGICSIAPGTELTLSPTVCTDQLELVDNNGVMATEVSTAMTGFITFVFDAVFTCSETTGAVTIDRSFANGTIAAMDQISFIDCTT